MLLCLLLMLSSCHRSISDRIYLDVLAGDTKIDINDYVDFPWDSAVIYSYAPCEDEVYSRFGRKNDFRLGTRPFVFYSHGKIVYFENAGSYCDDYQDGIIYHLPKDQPIDGYEWPGYLVVHKEKSQYKAKIKKYMGYYLVLLYDQ